MNILNHEYQGFKTSRWYRLQERRYLQLRLTAISTGIRITKLKGYGVNTAGNAPRACAVISSEIRGTVQAAEKLFERHIKETVRQYPEFSDRTILKGEEASQLDLAIGG
ncbi:MAG: hypothetical protein WED82_02040 [Balneolales bacterium]